MLRHSVTRNFGPIMNSKLINAVRFPTLIPRLVVGLIFLSEGLQKYITPDATGAGRFEKIGFAHPAFWAYFTGAFETVCGLLILIGFFTRLATIPLLIVMVVAFITTKAPLLIDQSFWTFAHAYRTDFAMTMLLIYLLLYSDGNNSIDQKFTHTSSV